MAEHVCPVWVGHLLASPLRRLYHNPEKILRPYVRERMTVLDVGCAMGFFSLPLARMVGPAGKVVCLDFQEGMLRALERRALRAGLRERIDARLCTRTSLDLADIAAPIEFALAFAVVHEVPDPDRLFRELHAALKDAATLLVAEPRGHVTAEAFAASLDVAQRAGFVVAETPTVNGSHAAALRK